MVRTTAAEVVDALRERWRARSLVAGWTVPADWWTPAVESVAEAVAGLDLSSAASGHRLRHVRLKDVEPDLARVLHRLGRARGRAGAGIGETLDDLGALFWVLCWSDPPLPLVRAVAEGWVDSGLVGLGADTCEDPLTGLVTLSYLRSRLAELYRAAAAMGTSVALSHCLVVVDLSDGSPPWRRLARAMVAAHDLRTVFDAGETLTLIGSGRAAALVAVRPELEAQTAALRRALCDGGTVWIERLPACCDDAMAVLDMLRGPRWRAP